MSITVMYGGSVIFNDSAATSVTLNTSGAYMEADVEVVAEGGGGSGEIDAFIQKTISGDYVNSAVSYVGSGAFWGCRELTTASFPACEWMGASAFAHCNSLTTVSFPACTSIGACAFLWCERLITASFPACTSIGSSAFQICQSLTTVSLPVCKSIPYMAFYNCYRITTANFPACTSIEAYAFAYCSRLATASFPKMIAIAGNSAFSMCWRLTSLYLTGSSLCTLSYSNAFNSSPIGGYSATAGKYGSIYVPASLLASYQAATNWTYFSSRFVGI